MRGLLWWLLTSPAMLLACRQQQQQQQQQEAGMAGTAAGLAQEHNTNTTPEAEGLNSNPITAAAVGGISSTRPTTSCTQEGGPTTSSSPAAALTAATLPPDLAAAAAAEGWSPDQLSATSLNTNKALQRSLVAWAAPAYEAMAAPAAALQRQLGNLYTGSVWVGLGALVAAQGEGLVGKRVLLYSFGSGAVASLLVVQGRSCDAGEWSLARMQQQVRSWKLSVAVSLLLLLLGSLLQQLREAS
jgi:hypothetical protein